MWSTFLPVSTSKIKSLFAKTLSASGESRENAFVDLRRLLAVHETVEEEIVHPRAKRKIANGAAVVDARLSEELEAKKVLAAVWRNSDVDKRGVHRQADLNSATPSSITPSTRSATSSRGWENN